MAWPCLLLALQAEGAAADEEEEQEETLYDLLNQVDKAEIDSIVSDLLDGNDDDDDDEEAEVPYLAMRRPVVFAMTVKDKQGGQQ